MGEFTNSYSSLLFGLYPREWNTVADMLNSGKPAGTNVSWYDSREIKFLNYTDVDDGTDYWIKSATVTMNWSDWDKY